MQPYIASATSKTDVISEIANKLMKVWYDNVANGAVFLQSILDTVLGSTAVEFMGPSVTVRNDIIFEGNDNF